jgi:ParB family chromosome partitioning protein
VRKAGDRYYIVAGERRYRATRLLGKKKIKASVIQTDEQDNVTLALIENIQRSNLDPIEEAKAYRVLLNRFKLKQNDIALKVGKDRATITNSLRLLNLPEDIQEGLSRGLISVGHAKVLLSLTDKDRQRAMFDEIVEKGLSVRSLETAVNEIKTVTGKSKPRGLSKKEAHIKKMEEKLIHVLGTKVEIRHSGSKGRIEIFYYSLDDFDRIVELIK